MSECITYSFFLSTPVGQKFMLSLLITAFFRGVCVEESPMEPGVDLREVDECPQPCGCCVPPQSRQCLPYQGTPGPRSGLGQEGLKPRPSLASGPGVEPLPTDSRFPTPVSSFPKKVSAEGMWVHGVLAGKASSGCSSALSFIQISAPPHTVGISSLGFHDSASGPLHMLARLLTTPRHLAKGISGG